MKRSKLKELVKSLYVNGKQTQKEISQSMDIPLATISRWAQKEKWSDLRASKIASKDESLKRLYEQINALTDVINSRENNYATTSEADTLNKLAVAINRLEKEDSNPAIVAQVLTKYTSWLSDRAESKEDKEFLGTTLDISKEYLVFILNK